MQQSVHESMMICGSSFLGVNSTCAPLKMYGFTYLHTATEFPNIFCFLEGNYLFTGILSIDHFELSPPRKDVTNKENSEARRPL